MSLILDSGALIALDRNDRTMWRRLKDGRRNGEAARTHAGVLGQVWRGGGRQARLSQVLSGIDVIPLTERLGRDAGELLGAARLSDVIDAALVLLAADEDHIATSDPGHLAQLAEASGRHVELIRV